MNNMIRILFLAATVREDYDFPEKAYYDSIGNINSSLVNEYKNINRAHLGSQYRDQFDLRFICRLLLLMSYGVLYYITNIT